MGGVTENPDTIVYETIYNSDSFFSKDLGFGVLIYLFNLIGFTYEYFRLTISLICILLINTTVHKFCPKPIYFYVLYIFSTFFFDTVQLRNIFGFSIITYALPLLLNSNWKNYLKFVFLAIIAASMQKTNLVYLPILIIPFILKKNLLRNLFLVLSCGILAFGFNNITITYLSNLVSWLSMFFDGLSGFSADSMNYGWTIVWGIQICNFILIFLCKNLYKKHLLCIGKIEDKTFKLIELIYGINAYLFLFLPLYALDINFIRIIRNVMILNSIVYSIIIYVLMKNKTFKFVYGELKFEKYSFPSVLFIYYSCFFYYQYLYGGEYFYSMIISSFVNNWLI